MVLEILSSQTEPKHLIVTTEIVAAARRDSFVDHVGSTQRGWPCPILRPKLGHCVSRSAASDSAFFTDSQREQLDPGSPAVLEP